MKVVLSLLALISIWHGGTAVSAQFRSHKSETEIERMTPEQRVEEYCTEIARHSFLHDEYVDLLDTLIQRDGLKAVPGAVKLIDDYNPSRGVSKVNDRLDTAQALLDRIDSNIVRLRASEQGRKGIEAMSRLLARMRAWHFDAAEADVEKQDRYKMALLILTELEGVNTCDQAIRNTLRIRYKLSLSDQEMAGLVSYLISTDPYYPGWSKREEYKDLTQRNEAGYPLWFVILKKPEPLYQAYLKYKAKDK